VYTVIRRHVVEQANVDEIVRRTIEGGIPIIQKAPGFLSYRLVKADDGTLITISIFETPAQGDESRHMAAAWFKENLSSLLPNPPQVIGGEVRVRHVMGGAPPTFGVMRRYPRVTDIAEVARRIEAGGLVGGLPTTSNLTGFATNVLVDPGDGSAVSLSAFRDRATAEQSIQVAHDWGQQHLAPFLLDPPEVTICEIVGGAP